MREARKPAPSPDCAEERGRGGIAAVGKDFLKVIDENIERARQYHAQHGVWPPDPLLDEVDDMRRQIRAEHGNDWRKVLQWHVEQDKLYAQQNGGAAKPAIPDESAAVSGR